MNTPSSLDRETFQQLLASAFAVQESQINSQSLSEILEVQRLVTSGKLDVDGAMRQIVEAAQNVANATGVAIGLFKGDQLIYRAGSGSTATYIGRHLTASLTVAADTQASREILRVEDAQADTRIEAEICRQFGAQSLLILPIYHDRAVAGILEVLFSEAHAFQDLEVRTYRLMAGQIEAAMFQAAQLEQKRNLTAAPPAAPHTMEQIPPQWETFLNDGQSLPGPAPKHSIYQRCGAALTVARRLPVFKQPALLATMIMQRAKEVTWHKRRRNLALAAVLTVLGLACWIVYRGRGPASPSESSGLPRSTAIERQVRPQAAKTMPEKGTSAPRTGVKQARPARTTLRRVRVGENEVDYIGDDVTVRYFTHRPAPQRKRVEESRVAYIGDDVTVRYFTSKPAVRPNSR